MKLKMWQKIMECCLHTRFFGYNKDLELQYRGRIRELKNLKPIESGDSELKNAMKMIAKSNNGPKEQFPSMGCEY